MLLNGRSSMRRGRATLRLVDLTGEPPEEFLIFRKGTNRSYKGELLFDEAAEALVLVDAKDHGTEFFIDYDHASLYGFSKDAGEAAAWFELEVREGELWARNVRWTEDGAAKVRSRKYRYISPAVDFDFKSKRILRLINVALTNLPASHNLPPLMAASQKEGEMLKGALAHIATELGLDPESATEDDVTKAFDERMAEGDEGDGDEESSDALAQIRALTGKSTSKDALAAALAELSAARASEKDREIEELINKGIAAKRIPTENREAFTRLGKRDLEALRELVGVVEEPPKKDKSKPASTLKRPAPPTSRHVQATLSSRTPALSEHDLSVARTLGLDPAAMTSVDD